jgi:hypothetical protein
VPRRRGRTFLIMDKRSPVRRARCRMLLARPRPVARLPPRVPETRGPRGPRISQWSPGPRLPRIPQQVGRRQAKMPRRAGHPPLPKLPQRVAYLGLAQLPQRGDHPRHLGPPEVPQRPPRRRLLRVPHQVRQPPLAHPQTQHLTVADLLRMLCLTQHCPHLWGSVRQEPRPPTLPVPPLVNQTERNC